MCPASEVGLFAGGQRGPLGPGRSWDRAWKIFETFPEIGKDLLEKLEIFGNSGKFLENWKAIGTFWRIWILLQRILGSFWTTILGSKTFQTLENHVGVIFKKWNQHLEHGQLLIFLV